MLAKKTSTAFSTNFPIPSAAPVYVTPLKKSFESGICPSSSSPKICRAAASIHSLPLESPSNLGRVRKIAKNAEDPTQEATNAFIDTFHHFVLLMLYCLYILLISEKEDLCCFFI